MSRATQHDRETAHVARDVMRSLVRVLCMVFMIQSECQLNPREQNVLRLPGDDGGRARSRAATARERGAREAGQDADVPVQPPVQSDGPGRRRAGRYSWIGEERERVTIDVQVGVTGNELHRAPTSCGGIKGLGGNNAL